MKFYCGKCKCDLCESARADWEAYSKLAEERLKANQTSANQSMQAAIWNSQNLSRSAR